MRIGIVTPIYYPEIGGTTTIAETLNLAFLELGHESEVLMWQPTGWHCSYFLKQLLHVVQRLIHLDAVVLVHPTLKIGLLARVLVKRMIISHHMIYENTSPFRISSLLRLALVHSAPNIACSSFVARSIPVTSKVVFNGYRNDLFHASKDTIRDIDVVFLGSLSISKGIDLAIDVIDRVADRMRLLGKRFTFKFVGPKSDSFEVAAALEARDLPLDSIHGPVSLEGVSQIFARAKVAIVPSKDEPFGIVALEAMACGACVVAAAEGGLIEAVGTGGVLLPRSRPDLWAQEVENLLNDEASRDRKSQQAIEHLASFHPRSIAKGYLQALDET